MNWDEAQLLGDLEAQEARMSDDLVKEIEALGKLKQRLRNKGSPSFFAIKEKHKKLKKRLAELTGGQKDE